MIPTILFDIWGVDKSIGVTSEYDGSPLVNIDLSRENRRFMNLRLNQVTNSFNEQGEMITTNKYFKVEKCTEEFYTKKD